MDQVTPDFVEEAFRLLKQSIISVEKDDVEFEDEPDADMADADEGAADGEGDSPMSGNDDEEEPDSQPAAPTPAPRPRTQIKYDDYIKIHNMLLRRVNEDQSAAEDGVEENDLLIWYLEQKEDELKSQEDMEEQRGLARKVLKRMVKVCLLIHIPPCAMYIDFSLRTTYFFRSAVKVSPMRLEKVCRRTTGWCTLCIPTARWMIYENALC